jgi:hypothetical protein
VATSDDHDDHDDHGAVRSAGRIPRNQILLILTVPLIALALMIGLPLPQSQAVTHGLPAAADSGQVRIFENGEFLGSGTLVDRNWVLTTSHHFLRLDSTAYSLRFGAVNDQADESDTSNLRAIDRIELHPDLADVALVHFADPVPPGTWMPSLATQPPTRNAVGRFYSWGPEGHVLKRVVASIIDPVAKENAAEMREVSPEFVLDFPPGIEPMVIDIATEEGDSGAAVLSADGVLLGIHDWGGGYQYVNTSGNFVGALFRLAYEQPVWTYRTWIQRIVSGEGTSGPSPSHDELKRRRLLDRQWEGDLPMTMPPQADVCDPGQPQCNIPDPVWQAATLTGYSHNQGTVPARCATADGNACTFDGVPYVGGATARLPLGAVGVTGTRRVMVWCRTTAALNVGDPPQPVLELSFSNDDDPQGPVGMGWWLVSPDHVTTGTNTPVDTTVFATC